MVDPLVDHPVAPVYQMVGICWSLALKEKDACHHIAICQLSKAPLASLGFREFGGGHGASDIRFNVATHC